MYYRILPRSGQVKDSNEVVLSCQSDGGEAMAITTLLLKDWIVEHVNQIGGQPLYKLISPEFGQLGVLYLTGLSDGAYLYPDYEYVPE